MIETATLSQATIAPVAKANSKPRKLQEAPGARSLKRLIAADNMTQKESAKVKAQLAIARAMMGFGRRGPA